MFMRSLGTVVSKW